MAPPVLGWGPWQCPASWVSVFSGWGRGTEWPLGGRGAAGSREGLCATLAVQTRPWGRLGPFSTCVPRTDRLRVGGHGQRRPATALQTLPSVMKGPTLLSHTQPTAHRAGPVGGGVRCAGGQCRPALWVPTTQGCRPAPAPSRTLLHPGPGARGLSLVPRPGVGVALPRRPPGEGAQKPWIGDPALRDKDAEVTVSSLLEKQPKKNWILHRCDPGRARGAWTRCLGGEGARLQSRQVIKKALRSSGPGLQTSMWSSSSAGPGRASDVHVVLVLVRLALQRGLLARRLQHLQRRLAQALLPHRGGRLCRQDGRLRRPGGWGSAAAQPQPTHAPDPGPPRT